MPGAPDDPETMDEPKPHGADKTYVAPALEVLGSIYGDGATLLRVEDRIEELMGSARRYAWAPAFAC